VDREIVAHWYRTFTFSFNAADKHETISSFLSACVSDKGLLPGDIVQYIEVTIDPHTVEYLGIIDSTQLRSWIEVQNQKQILDNLDALAKIPNKNVHLMLSLPWSGYNTYNDSLLRVMLRLVAPKAYHIRRLGFVDVKLRSDFESADTPVGGFGYFYGIPPDWRDLTYLFDGSEDTFCDRLVRKSN
jgi:hypothetical protein